MIEKTPAVLEKIESGEIAGKVSLPVLRQALYVMASNKRRALSKAKKRGEVRGGGRKPWRQKGTGRARVGSIRSPLWRGGGVVFGPTAEHHFHKSLPQKMKTKALLSALKLKSEKGKLFLLKRGLPGVKKTKEVLVFLSQLPLVKNRLIVIPHTEGKTSWRNLGGVSFLPAAQLNIEDILKAGEVVFLPEAWEIVKKRLAPEGHRR